MPGPATNANQKCQAWPSRATPIDHRPKATKLDGLCSRLEPNRRIRRDVGPRRRTQLTQTVHRKGERTNGRMGRTPIYRNCRIHYCPTIDSANRKLTDPFTRESARAGASLQHRGSLLINQPSVALHRQQTAHMRRRNSPTLLVVLSASLRRREADISGRAQPTLDQPTMS